MSLVLLVMRFFFSWVSGFCSLGIRCGFSCSSGCGIGSGSVVIGRFVCM